MRFKRCTALLLAALVGMGTVTARGEAVTQTKEVSANRSIVAVETATIYEDTDSNSKALNRIMRNQVVSAIGEKGDYYCIEYGETYAFVPKSSFKEGNELGEWIESNPDWFHQSVVIKHNTVLYDWVTGNPVKRAKVGESFQLESDAGAYYTAIYSYVGGDGGEISTLVNVSKQDSKLVYQVQVSSFGEYKEPVSSKRLDIVEYACSLVGTEYVWGGTDPATGVDCSGFVQYVYAKYGYKLPRVSAQQAEYGTRIGLDELEPGDLIFYRKGNRIGHVAMYVGDGRCVHARNKNYGVCITTLDYTKPAWAMRILE